MKAYRGSGGITPFLLNFGHYMVVNGQLRAPADLPQGRNPVAIEKEAGWVPETIWSFGRF